MKVREAMKNRLVRAMILVAGGALVLSACDFSPYSMPLPGGADTGDDPYSIKVEFRDVLDLAPQSGVRVGDVPVGRVTDIDLKGWHAVVTLKINRDAKLPQNAQAKIRQTSLLGEKFVSLKAPKKGSHGHLGDGDTIALSNSGRNPEIEEVLGAASLLLNGGGIDKVSNIVSEVNQALDGNEDDVKELVHNADDLVTQLDSHKGEILTAMEKINKVAVQADKQSDSITSALDTLPDALEVLNDQRSELVELLESLDKFGDVGARVIRKSKADLLANLKDLQPVLANLNKAGDNLVKSLRVLPTFPFPDEVVGGSYAEASSVCKSGGKADGSKNKGACMGDYKNLKVQLNLSAESLKDTIANLGESLGNAASDPGSSGLPGLDELPDLSGGLSQDKPKDSDKGDSDKDDSKKDDSKEKDDDDPGSPADAPKLCSVLHLCRSAPGEPEQSQDDARDLMLQAVSE